MTGSKGKGASEEERRNSGDAETNPSGTSSEKLAEGANDSPPPRPGSPNG